MRSADVCLKLFAIVRVVDMGKKIFLIIIVITAACSTVAPAQEAASDRDPFYPSEQRRPAASAPSPAGADWGRDPFNSPFAGKGPVQQQDQNRSGRARTLTGIIYGKNVRLAIIGGETLGEGSMVGEQKLVDIRRRSVVLMNPAGGSEEIFLENFSIRK
jgi:hypothetical protein